MSINIEYRDYTIKDFEMLYGDGLTLFDDTPSIGLLWREMKERIYSDAGKVIFGLGRGQVGLTVASTDIGKTTFALNVALTLAAGKTFEPFVEEPTAGCRVLFIDGENTQAELQLDLKIMMREWDVPERERVADNLLILCDEEIDGELLTLSKPNHMAAVMQRAREFRPDLIIVDTMAALFSPRSENDNAEIKRVVMQPLRTLAREANSVVWLQHHSGKNSEESRATNPAYSGRGGSQFGGLARTVLKLRAPNMSDKKRVILSVSKAKGYRLPDVAMRLDEDARWFEVIEEKPPADMSSYSEVVQFVAAETRTEDIIMAFDGRYSRRTIEGILTQAVRQGDLIKVRRGFYAPSASAITADLYSDCGSCGNGDEEMSAPN